MKRKKQFFENLIIVVFGLCVILPLFTVLIWAFTERWAWPSLWPQVFSLRAVKSIVRDGIELARLFLSSICISLVVAVFSVVIGVMTARALSCYSFYGKKIFSFLSLLPFLVPSTVFAMGIQMLFIKLGLSSTVTGVILVHVICSLPYAVRLMEEGTRAVGTRLEEQARVLGAGPFRAFWSVTIPSLLPIILSAFSMAYIVSFSQYFLTLIIGGGSVKTFSIVMVPFLQSGYRNFASVYSLIFLGITILIFGIFEWIVQRWSKEQDIEYYDV